MQSTRTRHPVVLYSRHGERGATWFDVARELTVKRARRALSIWVQVRLNVGCKKRLGVRAGAGHRRTQMKFWLLSATGESTPDSGLSGISCPASAA